MSKKTLSSTGSGGRNEWNRCLDFKQRSLGASRVASLAGTVKPMFAPLAKSADWLAIQLVWGRRCRALLKQQGNGSSSRLEEAIDFLHGPDFAPAEVPSARLEFEPAEGGRRFRFVTPRPSGFAESNVACGRLYRCGDQWRERPAVILLHGAGGADYRYEFPKRGRNKVSPLFSALLPSGIRLG